MKDFDFDTQSGKTVIIEMKDFYNWDAFDAKGRLVPKKSLTFTDIQYIEEEIQNMALYDLEDEE